MTRHVSFAVGTVGAIALATSAFAANSHTMVAALRSGQEVPVNPSTARGCARIEVDTNANTLKYYIAYGGLSAAETAAHIHGFAPPGVNAGILHFLPAGNPKVGVWNYLEAQEAGILAGNTYINIHTAANPGGEIRGQITDYTAILDGFQENPVVTLPSQGWAVFMVDTCTNTLSYHIVVESLSGPQTAHHIHGLALPGTNAGILHFLPAGNPKIGSWTYNESQEPAVLAGLTYVNIHTAANPGGEIRGQIVNTVVPIDATQEVPANPSTAFGCGFIANDPIANTLGYYITYAGLSAAETAAHIHGYSAAGINSGIQHFLPATNPKKGIWNYGAANAANIAGDLTYINIHTTANPGGEIRGQIITPLGKCMADVNCDGGTNVDDLLLVINGWGPCPAPPAPCPADTDYSGTINVDDLLNVINGWGKCP